MSKITLVYLSNTGNTEAMANLLADGLKQGGAEFEMLEAASADADKVKESDIIVMGAPACGTEEVDEEYIVPLIEDMGDLSGKKVALFGSFGWGGGEYMDSWVELVESKGAEIIGNPITHLESPDDEDVKTSLVDYGKEIAGA